MEKLLESVSNLNPYLGNFPSTPSPKLTLTPVCHLRQNVGLGERRWEISQTLILIQSIFVSS